MNYSGASLYFQWKMVGLNFSHVIAECLKKMRQELDKLLEEKIAKPVLDLTKNVKGKLMIDTIINLIQKE